jgi:hypothetical protein
MRNVPLILTDIVCRTEITSDYQLNCARTQRVVPNTLETQHSPRTDAPQLCDIATTTNEQVFSFTQSGVNLNSDCVFGARDQSTCTIQASALQRYFAPVTGVDQFWNPIPKRAILKYTCQNSARALKVSALIGIACLGLLALLKWEH